MVGGGSFLTAYGRVSCYKTFVIISAAIVLENLSLALEKSSRQVSFISTAFSLSSNDFLNRLALLFHSSHSYFLLFFLFCLSLLTLQFFFFFFFFTLRYIFFKRERERSKGNTMPIINISMLSFFFFFYLLIALTNINYVNQNRRNGEISRPVLCVRNN